MNNLLMTAGDVLNIVFGIVGFPVLLVFKCMIWAIVAYRFMKRQANMVRYFRAKPKASVYRMPRPAMGLAFQKVA
jgi:hypothetical protein